MGIALLGVQVGPWLWQEFIKGDTQHLRHGHDCLQRGIGWGVLAYLAPFHSLVLVSRQACVIGHAPLGEAALDAEALEVDAQLLGVPRPFLRIVFNVHAPKICGVRISLGHKVVAFAIL